MDTTGLYDLLVHGEELSASVITKLNAAALPAALAAYARLRQTAISGAPRLAKITFGNDTYGTTKSPTIAVTDDGSTGHASLEVVDFPASVIQIDAVYTNLSFTTTAAWAPTTPVIAFGTAAAAADATLTGTEADIVPSTALTISGGGSTLLSKITSRAVAQFTDNSGGSVSSTLAAITAPGANATTSLSADMGAAKNAIASLAGKLDAILGGNAGIEPLIYDGTSGAKKLYMNFGFNSDPAAGKTIIPSGSIWCWWRNLTP